MHNAPAVTYPVGRSSIQGVVGLALWLLGLAAIAAWGLALHDWKLAAAGASLSVAVAVPAAAGWWRTSPGELQWHCGVWHFCCNGQATEGRPAVVMDLQACMLLRWQPIQGTPLWLWPQRSGVPVRWDDLRRAVYSRAIVDAPLSSHAATP